MSTNIEQELAIAQEIAQERFVKLERFIHGAHDTVGTGYAGGPYSTHLKQVDDQLREWLEGYDGFIDPRLKLTVRYGGLLHDYFEDVLMSPELWPAGIKELRARFHVPLQSLDMALLCTDPPGNTRTERKFKAYPRIAQCHGALLIKLSDRTCHLVASHGSESRHYLAMYLEEHDTFRSALCRVIKARHPSLERVYHHACRDYFNAVDAARAAYAKGIK